ncbi:penicillin-binding protein 1B [Desulfoferula mesophila]|uniref:Penicillin-binding protein 1B n=1 Tax=Desulfoferula mesophila TaxID=3058419 RepID=A0AAU9E9K0_9BACT|nr:penicillin-binding protein 1B [Desulfoferula mesophilus]
MAKRPAPKKPATKAKRKTAAKSKAPAERKSPAKAKAKTAKRKPTKRKTAKKRRFTLKRLLAYLVLIGLLAAAVFTLYLDVTVRARFEGKRFALPARVYARPLELYPGLKLSPEDIRHELDLLRYRRAADPGQPGSYAWNGSTLDLRTRPFVFGDGSQAALSLRVEFRGGRVAELSQRGRNKALAIARLDPPLIGGIYPGRNEDRILVQLKDAPQWLIDALIATEDRRFYSHYGLDPLGIARALVVTVGGGRVQGGSTLTQQLAKNFFLTPERTLQRKFTEMVMALLLELHYSKQEILETYLNEVYLGQDGNRAIHGFGLAASFYFDKPLNELSVPQAALLVGMLKGPSYYSPRRHPQRALKRRNLVLEEMAQDGKLSPRQLARAQAAPLGVVARPPSGASPYPAFLQLVYRQLKRDYRDEDLRSEGLGIITTLDPVAQRAAERALSGRLARLEKDRRLKSGTLQGALVITSTQNAEVQAVVGGRDPRFEGFNRALDAQRPIGSLVKPVVYLTALEHPQRYTLATLLDDSPLLLKQKGSEDYAPQNFDKRFHGRVPLIDCLVHSYNVPTVRLGLAVGIPQVLDNLRRLGARSPLPGFASSLLGAGELAPLEVAQVYQTIAAGGFRTPLRAIRAVLTSRGEPLKRYPLKVEQTSDPAALYLLTTAMQEVVRRGTARSLDRYLPASLDIAGKTGTTDGLRDSWFAGFTGDRLAVAWVGRDDNRPTGLTGASGAMVVWGQALAALDPQPLVPTQPDNVAWAWVDPASGLLSARGCPGAMNLPFIAGSAPTRRAACGGSLEQSMEELGQGMEKMGTKVKRWFERIFD